MKIGFVQFNPSFGNKKENCATVERLLENTNADVIVLPELFNTGYAFLNKQELTELAEPSRGETNAFIHNLAKKKKCAFAFGFAEKAGDLYYNSMSFVAPAGVIANYRKSHLFFEERFLFQPGDTGFHVCQYADVKFGLLICWDWIYPEAMRTLALKGAQIILHAANLVTPYCPDAMVTRAIENRVFIVTADRAGDEIRGDKNFHFIGMSQVVAPNGEILVRIGEETDAKVATVNLDEALDKKMNIHNDLFLDRRDDLYYR
ncbi:MAG: nitrilase-related carbon-nitrogen hydrolase [bacterium]